jgi:hypothetical protein
MDITSETPLRRSLETYYAPVGTDQGVILNINANRYHSLNTVGARIWELLETPQTAGELCSHLLEEFEVDAATCQAVVLEFASHLLERGIIHADPA